MIDWFPAALLLTAAIIPALFVMRHFSLRILENAPEFTERARYIRGARWGWLVCVVSFVGVVVAVSAGFDYGRWDFQATALAWLTALLPVAGSVGFLLLPEFMGFWVWAQAGWERLGGQRLDWMRYRTVASRLEVQRGRWTYYAAWVVGSAALTASPLWTYAAVHAG